MPDTGASRPVSHTATEQWQSFEMRMRQRRARRCRLRAQVAMEAGSVADATAALAEARRLEPDAPENRDLERLIAAGVPNSEQEKTTAGNVSKRLMVAALVPIAVGGAVWVGLSLGVLPIHRAANTASTSPPPSEAPASDTRAVKAISTLTVARPVTGAGTLADPGNARADAVPEPAPAVDPLAVGAVPTSSAQPFRLAAPDPGPAATSGISSSIGTPASVSAPVPVDEPARPAPPQPRQPIAEPRTAAPAGDEAAGIKEILSRYEAAYTSLDAAAAGDVWPDVDRRALARAFESLQSQQVSLGDCNVTITGATAHAECSGSTTWTPKVGGGARTEARSWTFDLSKQDNGWLIRRARIR